MTAGFRAAVRICREMSYRIGGNCRVLGNFDTLRGQGTEKEGILTAPDCASTPLVGGALTSLCKVKR
jgi:hypothetical protein